MGSKECDIRTNLEVSEHFKFIRNKDNSIVGIEMADGSFDYSPKGQKFLRGDVKDTTP